MATTSQQQAMLTTQWSIVCSPPFILQAGDPNGLGS